MKIVLTRVDDRLIHGQVVVGWSRTVGATHIVVADDEVAASSMQKTLLKMATPAGLKSSILSVAEAAEQLLGGNFSGEKVLLLVKGPAALLQLANAGVKFEKINVGNVRSTPGRTRLTKEVHATPEELNDWRELDRLGIPLEAQWLPDQARTDFNQIVRKEA